MRLYKYRIPDPSDIVTCPGSSSEPVYNPKFNGSHIVLEKSGTVDVQSRINSYAPYCDLRYMLNQLRVGDRSALSIKQPLFGDFSGFPPHPVDALNFIQDVQRTFERLPDETKQACNNDWRVYFTQLVTSQPGNSSGSSSDLSASDASSSDVGKDVLP